MNSNYIDENRVKNVFPPISYHSNEIKSSLASTTQAQAEFIMSKVRIRNFLQLREDLSLADKILSETTDYQRKIKQAQRDDERNFNFPKKVLFFIEYSIEKEKK